MRGTSPIKTQSAQSNIPQTHSSALHLPSFQSYSHQKLSNKQKLSHMEDRLQSYSRFIPKNFSQDKEGLYSENIKLRQKIKQLTDLNIRLKTHLAISQKQKNQLVRQNEKFVDGPQKAIASKSLHQPKASNPHSINLNSNTLARKLLRDANQQISKLKAQNIKIRKNIKYTQINEIKIQNKVLLQQLTRLQSFIQHLKQQNSHHIQNQQHNEELKKKILKQNEMLKQASNQIKNQQHEIEELKRKLEKNKKNKNQAMLNREVSELKRQLVQIRKPSLSKRKEQKLQQKASSQLKIKVNQEALGSLKKLENISIKSLKSNTKKLEPSEQKKSSKYNNNKNRLQQSQEQIKKPQIIKKQQKKSAYSSKKYQYQEELPKQQYQEQFEQIGSKQESKISNSQFNTKREQKANTNQQKKSQKLSQEFLIDEEVPEANLSQQKSNLAKTNIDKILQQTIRYKFLAQQYAYENFSEDIKNTGVKQFTYDQVSKLLSNQPFYLLDQQKKQLLLHCFGKEKQISAATFLRKIKPYIGEVEVFSEKQEKNVQQKLTKYFKNNHIKIQKQFKKMQKEQGLVSQSNFKKVLREQGIQPRQIQYCLGQICILSVDIENLNYQEFLQRFIKAN